MKKAFAYLAGAAVLAGSPAPAWADSYVIPDAVTPWVFEGGGTFSAGAVFTCYATIEFHGSDDSGDSSPSFSHTDIDNLGATITFSGGLFGICGIMVVAPIAAGDISYARINDTTGTLTFNNVSATFATNPACTGSLEAIWDEAAQSLTLTSMLASPCVIDIEGVLVSPAPGDIVDVLDGNHSVTHP